MLSGSMSTQRRSLTLNLALPRLGELAVLQPQGALLDRLQDGELALAADALEGEVLVQSESSGQAWRSTSSQASTYLAITIFCSSCA